MFSPSGGISDAVPPLYCVKMSQSASRQTAQVLSFRSTPAEPPLVLWETVGSREAKIIHLAGRYVGEPQRRRRARIIAVALVFVAALGLSIDFAISPHSAPDGGAIYLND